MRARSAVLVLALAGGLVLGAGSGADAATGAPILTGEAVVAQHFDSQTPSAPGEFRMSGSCDAGGGSISFTSSGRATGSYPGPFQLSGTLTYGPLDSSGNGAITGFTQHVRVASSAGDVVLDQNLGPVDPRAGGGDEVIGCYGTDLDGSPSASFFVGTTYVATITTDDAVYSDKGVNAISADESDHAQETNTNFVSDRKQTKLTDQRPVASFTIVSTGYTVKLDGRASVDPDGTITGYAWDFGDGSDVATGKTVKHVYATSGEHLITLTVQDRKGATGASSQTVVMTPPTSAAQCKQGGWRTYGFASQADCIASVTGP